MSWHRIFGFILCIAFAGTASSAQLGLVPVYDFKDIEVVKPTTARHVKWAIVQSALTLKLDVVEQADGSLLLSTPGSGNASATFRITYDATKYSLTYVDSTGLSVVPEDKLQYSFRSANTEQATAESLQKYAGAPDTPFTVKTKLYIHVDYEDGVRQLLIAVRRHLQAPLF
jgi:hypothetical protein